MKKCALPFRTLFASGEKVNCVATIGAVRFSAAALVAALFIFKEDLKMSQIKRVIAMLICIAMLTAMLASCNTTSTPGPQGEPGAQGVQGIPG